MRTYLDCLPCLMSQALKAARAATDDEKVHRRVLDTVAGIIPQISLDLRPPEIAQQGYRLIHLLVEELHRVVEVDTTFVVRERPIINDATLDDALAEGMDRVATVISSGSDAPATILSRCSPEMLRYYRSADVIIAKGQGNYESLDGELGNIFFLLRAKCLLLAKLLGVKVGDAILKQCQHEETAN